MRDHLTPIAGFSLGLLLAIVLTFVTIAICRKHGWVAKPRPDRWHRGTPAFFGGVAIWLAFLAAGACVVPLNDAAWRLAAVSSMMFLLGLFDDVRPLRPGPKLLAQFAVAGCAAAWGIALPVCEYALVNTCLGVFWVVAVSNALNLFDNMDGLSSGFAVICAGWMVVGLAGAGEPALAGMSAALAGSAAGFLLFNAHPARIFMGDCGSLLLGSFLATSSLSFGPVAMDALTGIIAAALLSVPLLDMIFVALTRRLRGQPISRGGTDHASHRLVRLGMSERAAVAALHALALVSGAVAIAAIRLSYAHALLVLAVLVAAVCVLGVGLFFLCSNGALQLDSPAKVNAGRP